MHHISHELCRILDDKIYRLRMTLLGVGQEGGYTQYIIEFKYDPDESAIHLIMKNSDVIQLNIMKCAIFKNFII